MDLGVLFVERPNAQPEAGVKEKETKTRQHRRFAFDAQTGSRGGFLHKALRMRIPSSSHSTHSARSTT